MVPGVVAGQLAGPVEGPGAGTCVCVGIRVGGGEASPVGFLFIGDIQLPMVLPFGMTKTVTPKNSKIQCDLHPFIITFISHQLAFAVQSLTFTKL